VLEADDSAYGIDAKTWACKIGAALHAEGIKPRMVIDSGGKSAHVWLPRAAFLARYQAGLPDQKRNKGAREILKVDPACLRIGQPVRLAGVQGEGRKNPASIYYIQQ